MNSTPRLIASSAATTAFLLLLCFVSLVPTHSFEETTPSSAQVDMRAWTCHGKNQRDLVDRLMQAGIVQTPAVKAVLEAVDRANYMPKNPYMDAPQPIGIGQTISAPHMHAHVLEEIYPYLVGKDNVKMLDVGCGSGYLTATLGRWVQSKPNPGDEEDGSCEAPILGNGTAGKVFGVDVHLNLIKLTTENIRRGDSDLLDTGMVKVQLRDGWKGWLEEAPFDVIHVGAAAESMPYELAAQLKVGGVMIVPIGPQSDYQSLYKIERVAQTSPETFNTKDYQVTNLLGVRYVPLIHPNHLN